MHDEQSRSRLNCRCSPLRWHPRVLLWWWGRHLTLRSCGAGFSGVPTINTPRVLGVALPSPVTRVSAPAVVTRRCPTSSLPGAGSVLSVGWASTSGRCVNTHPLVVGGPRRLTLADMTQLTPLFMAWPYGRPHRFWPRLMMPGMRDSWHTPRVHTAPRACGRQSRPIALASRHHSCWCPGRGSVLPGSPPRSRPGAWAGSGTSRGILPRDPLRPPHLSSPGLLWASGLRHCSPPAE